MLQLLVGFSCFQALALSGGAISGTVKDPDGKIVVSAVVRIINRDTGVAQKTASNEVGFYAFPSLPSGNYELHVEHGGFRVYRQTGLEVTSNAALRVDVELALGSLAETIVVSASTTQVEAASTQLGELIDGKQMTAVPINGRSYTDILALQPAVTPVSSRQPNAVVMAGCTKAPPSGDLNPGDMSVSGQRETANGFTVNGAAVQEGFNMFSAIVPNLESIQEFRVLTSNFDAEHGNYSGGQVIVTTRSGTNELHGSVFDYLRNTGLAARNFFAPARASYDRNQFGGSVGGAIRREKAFFFVDYQGTRMTRGVDTGLLSVPSQRNRSGDFSDISATLTGKVNGQYWADRLSQRLGYPVYPGEPYYVPGCTDSSQCVLPNAGIPQSAWSAPAKNLLQFIPEPNSGENVFSTSAQNQTLRDDKGAVRFDYNSRLGAVSAYYFVDDYMLDDPYPVSSAGANVPGFNALSLGRAQMVALSLTSSRSGTINELRFSYMRTANDIGRPVGGVGPTLVSQGFVDENGNPSIIALAPEIEGIENVSFNDFTIGVGLTGAAQANNTFQISDSFSKVAGRHIFKVGASMHIDQINIAPNASYNGGFVFQGTETGFDFADYLLGIASIYAQGDSDAFYPRNKYIGLYAQDSWQLRSNVTLNYGLRWDMLPPWSEKLNQFQTLVLGQQSVVFPGAPAGLVFAGDPGIPETLAPVKYTNFGPRVGLAYAPDFGGGFLGKLFGSPQKTSIRLGFGVYYTAIEGLSAGIMSANPPYGMDYDSFAPPLFENPFVTAATGENVGQRFPAPIAPPGASAENPNTSVDWSMYLPIAHVPAYFHKNVTPYTNSYTLSIQRELWRNTVLTASYVGSQSHHLLVITSANPGNPALCLYLSRPENVMPGTATCGPFGENGVYVTRAEQVIQGTRGPFDSNFAGVNYQKTIGNSSYNSFQVSLRHTSRRLQLQMGYTYGKSLDQSSNLSEGVYPAAPRLNNALSGFDLRHNFVTSYNLELPIGAVLGDTNRLTDGWTLSGITRISTGFPVTLFNHNDTSLLGSIPNGINTDGIDTPDYTPGNLEINTDPRRGNPAFNAALFSLPSLGNLGTSARRFFYGPGMVNFDMALQKILKLRESKALELRFEAFNVFNHAQFFGAAAVNGNITSPSFGQVVAASPARVIQIAAKYSF
jgi:hypothetical protein